MGNSVITVCRDGLPTILLSFSFVVIVSTLIAYCFSSVQPGPYMDEYFHTRQTLTYLAGNWSVWDNKISTPPGTYILFVALYKITDALFVHLPQSPPILFFRCFSAAFSGLNYLLLLTVLYTLRHRFATLLSLVIITNPVLYFFSSMYYTDQCSLFFVLLVIYLSLKGFALCSAACCLLATSVRQTNIVWLLVSVGMLVAQSLSEHFDQSQKLLGSCTWIRYLATLTVGRPWYVLRVAFRSTFSCIWHFLAALFFLFFVKWNGGVALGDRAAHHAVVHVPQLWYFVSFCAFFTPLSFCHFVVDTVNRYRRMLLKAPLKFCLCLALWFLVFLSVSITLKYFLYVHPYLLADNRHYMFYIWRRVIKRSQTVYYTLSIPYTFGVFYWLSRLFSYRTWLPLFVGRLALIVGVCCCLIPAGLIEVRYFIVPYVLWRLFTTDLCETRSSLGTELVINLFLHFLTCYYFIFMPFQWPYDPQTIQRFMW
ncbi:alpha-1,2-glucosyltransferase [Paragonimus westermani]|uniref:Dol-P-Glc:Glc(2)Man(9)GlcNAc(2)-PP-Dol alpha-1,2-glucosyltransferase n=1 Tax=Paragonimus westermani TaxID=34504 RepID=A0A5J4N849_9TREM|nr:alpha-1,2-glucosyltransferase [Paragonimus westermani]